MKELPGFARFLLDNHLNDVVREMLRLSREMNVPILKYLNKPEDELITLALPGYRELLQAFIDNTTDDVIQRTVALWKSNQLPIIEKDQIVADDITLVAAVRRKTFHAFIPKYTDNLKKSLAIVEEIETYLVAYTTEFFKTYTNLLNERIETHLEQFRHSDRLFRQAASITHIGNYVWDLRTMTLTWSDELWKMYEVDPKSGVMNNEIARKYNHPDDNVVVDTHIGRSLQTGEPFDFHYRLVFEDGREKTLHARGEIEHDAEGKPIKIFGTAQDVTEQIKAEQILVEKSLELEQSNKSLEEFAFIASHDLKEPLRKISTLTDRLVVRENVNLSDEGKIYLQKVVNSSIRMQRMIDELLSLAQVTSDRSYQETSLQTVLHDVLQTFEQKIEEIKGEVISNGLPHAVVVPSQFRQLFQNLISNSLKFRKAEVPVRVEIKHDYLTPSAVSQHSLHPAHRYLRLTFSDNGIGFDNRFLPKIFSIFQRLHPRHKYEGSGIGLSICKKIVENHSGVIFANGVENEGCTFTIIVPDKL